MMKIETTSLKGDALRLRVSDKLGHDDYRAIIPILEEAITKHGKISLLVDITGLGSVEFRALFDDLPSICAISTISSALEWSAVPAGRTG
ncbi:MAG: STAS/SEC14 domain-containing protein [Alphaproteobacteria bacterium]|jgi:hypothetical protein|nr:STAS/SEC14 domain-containing protein [Rhodospirillaceae bacterium]MDG2480348.1 STAS/SEC14 domain-containing protein [Alphaproteobacteria bacterium]MBT6204535.1 STAS/SEC14 domain-containing protein [Rhodospirillaceae bacterium]MBT6511517.1 STAS/SEC14 domain-containing protein [Rhodospirillaceae bacterium]MBT7612648.1 STAS/SEC14 domain-containing protein [Rhodospirillaceae bacterium]